MSAEPYVLVIGGMNIDIQGKSSLHYRPKDSNPGSLKLFPGGVGRNIAENLARLGSRVELVSVLGDDEFSGTLVSSCASVGIGLEGCLRLKDSPASGYLCLLDADGSLVGAVSSMDSMDSLVPERLAERAALLDAAELILVDANLCEASIAWLAARYPPGTKRPLLGFDPVSVKKAVRGKAYLASFAFAKPNREEAALLTGLAAATAPAELARALRSAGLGEAFVSLGREGLLAESGSERWIARLPDRLPPGLEPVNASGAGDAAGAAIAWGLLQGRSPGKPLGLGERCALALALAAAMLASASESPVNPEMSAARLCELAEGIERERVS
jgi:pseudouridine kinase